MTDRKREAVVLMCDATGLSQRRACRLDRFIPIDLALRGVASGG